MNRTVRTTALVGIAAMLAAIWPGSGQAASGSQPTLFMNRNCSVDPGYNSVDVGLTGFPPDTPFQGTLDVPVGAPGGGRYGPYDFTTDDNGDFAPPTHIYTETPGTWTATATWSGGTLTESLYVDCGDVAVISSLKLDPEAFTVESKPTPLGPPLPKRSSGRPTVAPQGAHIDVSLTRASLVHFFVRRDGAPPPSRNRIRHGFNRQLQAGTNEVPFTGTLYGKPLRPGSYELYARAVDSSGKRLRRASTPFKILR